MNDMTAVIVPKSDQISADDFIAGPKTYTIDAVDIRPGTEQPVSIFLIGEPRAWKPCKSMSRVLVQAWGPDAKVYQGRAVTLYRDPKVKWGGMEVGGIRISHMSHIDREMLLQLTATKGKRAPHIVKPMAAAQPAEDPAADWCAKFAAKVAQAPDSAALEQLVAAQAKRLSELATKRADLHTDCERAIAEARAKFAPASLEGGRTDEQHGDQFDGAETPNEGF